MTTFLLPDRNQLLEVWVEMHPGTMRVSLDGPVCAATASHLESELWRMVDNGRNQIQVDADAVTVFTTDGIDALQRVRAHLTDRRGALWITSCSRITRRVLEICGATDLVRPDNSPGRSGNGSSEPDRPSASTTSRAAGRG